MGERPACDAGGQPSHGQSDCGQVIVCPRRRCGRRNRWLQVLLCRAVTWHATACECTLRVTPPSSVALAVLTDQSCCLLKCSFPALQWINDFGG